MHKKSIISLSDFAQVARGFLMGGADIVPGVSGGTVALILGIYEHLVTCISRFDLTLAAHLRKKDWVAAARHVDLRFLITLGIGVVLGITGLATLMHYLLEHHRQPTYAAFFGLILASCVLVGRVVRRWTPEALLSLAAATGFAFWLVGLPFLQSPPSGNAYIFLSGAVAICAMILPGVSGAFLLLILGKYHDITGLLRDVLHGQISLDALITIAIFVSGCLVGLLSFSKILQWLLARYESGTMAILCGLMAGSLRKIWPFKQDLTPQVSEFKLKEFANIWPEPFNGDAWLAVGIAIAAAGFVFLLDWLSRTHGPQREIAQKPTEP